MSSGLSEEKQTEESGPGGTQKERTNAKTLKKTPKKVCSNTKEGEIYSIQNLPGRKFLLGEEDVRPVHTCLTSSFVGEIEASQFEKRKSLLKANQG